MPQLRPQRIGDVPQGLAPHHREFLRQVKDALEIFMGAVVAQDDERSTPGSQVVTFDDLADWSTQTLTENHFSRIFMHMGAL